MHVVVTGGAGFIGANLVRALVDSSEIDRVVVVDDLSTGRPENLDGVDAETIVASVLDPDAMDAALAHADAVVHLAAIPSVPRSLADPMASHQANATGTVSVLEAVRRHRVAHVVVASSSSVYGANPALPKTESMRPAPVSPYAVSKLATEAYALAYAECFSLKVLAFRFFNVFGPLQTAGHAYAAVIPRFVEAALAGRPLVMYGDGEQTRDFTYVGSVSSVIRDALLGGVANPTPVNLAFGTRTSLNGLVSELETVLGQKLAREHADPRPGDVRDSQADTARLLSLFPDATPVPLRDGLGRTVEWFQTLTDSPPVPVSRTGG